MPGRPLGVAIGERGIYVGNETSAAVEVYRRAGRSEKLKLRARLNGEPITHPTDVAEGLVRVPGKR